MAIITKSKRCFENKSDDFKKEYEDVESCDSKILSGEGCKKGRDVFKPTSKYSEDSVESCDKAIFSGSDDEMNYLGEMRNVIKDELQYEVDNIAFSEDDESFNITVYYDDQIMEFKVPYEDLTFDWDKIDEDIHYVMNTIIEEIERNI